MTLRVRFSPVNEPHYDAQQVCMHGHQITASYHELPHNRQERCDQDGLPTIYQCTKCHAEIRGRLISSGVLSHSPVPIPNHCHKCGEAYPWTQSKKIVSAWEGLHSGRPDVELPSILEKIGLSDNWRVASSALAAFEVMVTRKLESLGLSTGGEYDTRIDRLADALKKQGISFDAIMISSFRTARVKVLHVGKNPTENELKDIIKYLKSATHALFPESTPMSGGDSPATRVHA